MASSKKVNVGIVGIGRAAWGMQAPELKARSRKFNIVAGCDIIEDRNASLQDTYGSHIKGYSDIKALVKDPNVDLVSIATRSTDHVEHARIALAAGKHVFLEKPIAIKYQDAKKLKRYAAKAKGKLFVRHNRRFEACFNHIQDILKTKVLGDVHTIKLHRHNYSQRDDWQTIVDCGGGQLLNWGPHLVDHGLQFLNYNVTDTWSSLRNVAALGDAEDHFKIVMKGKSGCVVDIEVSGGAALSQDVYVIMGDRGALTSDEKTIKLRYLHPSEKKPRRKSNKGTPPLGASFHQTKHKPLKWVEKEVSVKPKAKCVPSDIWDHVYANLRQGKKYPITLDQSLAVMEVISSVKKGTPFEI